jgi:hypothetical protein
MRLLSRLLDEAKELGPRAVLLFGDAGIGKSRIATEFATRADLEGCVVVHIPAHPYDEHRPMGAATDLVRTLLKQPGALGCDPTSMGWLQRLLSIEGADTTTPTLSSEETAHAIARAIVDLLSAVAAEAPIVLLLDDAQWIDKASLCLFRDIVLDSEPSGVVILLTARDERAVAVSGDWGEHLLSCRIGPLERSVALQLLSADLSASSETDGSLADWMADIANGNPFYADSVLAHYRTTGERFVVPPQLSAIVDRRVRAVSAEARDVLETIVALGRHATIDRLERVLQSYGPSLMRHARELGTARLISGEDQVRPAHWLIAESVQRNAEALSQRLLYRRIAAVLESEVQTEGDSGELWACAQAWLAGGDSNRAGDLMARCGTHALQIGRAREASDLYYRAAGVVDPERIEGLAEESVRAAASGGEPNAIVRGMPLLKSRDGKRLHDDIEIAELRARIWCDWELDETLANLYECFTTESADRSHRLSAARAFLGLAADGRLVKRGLDAVDSVKDLLARTLDLDDPIWLQCATVFHEVFGDSSQVRPLADRLVAIAAIARPDEATNLLRLAAASLVRVGERAVAMPLWQRAHDIADQAGLTRLTLGLKLTLASQFLDAGDPDAGRHWFEQIVLPAREKGNHALEFLHWSYLSLAAEFAMLANDRAEMEEICHQASDLSSIGMGSRTIRTRTLLSCLLRHLTDTQDDPEDVAAMLTVEQVPGYEPGVIGDFEMTVLITIFRDRGEASGAVEHLRRYLALRRRPRLALSANLVKVAASLGITAAEKAYLRRFPAS